MVVKYSPRTPLAVLVFILGLLLSAGCGAEPGGGRVEARFSEVTAAGITALEKSDAGDGFHRKPLNVREPQVLAALQEQLAQATPGEPPADRYRGSFRVSFALTGGAKTKQCPYVYNDLAREEPGYIRFSDGWYTVPGEFHALLEALDAYPDASAKVDPTDARFLAAYGWTPILRINTLSATLPLAFVHRPGEYPRVLYWAYNNELNKDVGLDLTPYLGRKVQVNLYKTVEFLPEFMQPRREAGRAVVVRHQGEIVGAWLDAGRHNAFACSLEGRPLEEVAGLTWEEWIPGLIDPADPFERQLAALAPEEVVKAWFDALGRGDGRTYHALQTRRLQAQRLFSNMDNRFLYNPAGDTLENEYLHNVTSAHVLEIKPLALPERPGLPESRDSGSGGSPESLRYVVEVDLQVKRFVTHGSGPQMRFVTLVRETSETGWRIDASGTGP